MLANRVGSAGHAAMLRESLPPGLAWWGALPRDEACALPSRHLGLVQADEVVDLEPRIERAAQALDAMQSAAARSPCGSRPRRRGKPLLALLADVCIAVARDAAFSFLYRANLDTLQALGAQVLFFSPLADEPVPAAAHAVYLPGGLPGAAPGLPGLVMGATRASLHVPITRGAGPSWPNAAACWRCWTRSPMRRAAARRAGGCCRAVR